MKWLIGLTVLAVVVGGFAYLKSVAAADKLAAAAGEAEQGRLAEARKKERCEPLAAVEAIVSSKLNWRSNSKVTLCQRVGGGCDSAAPVIYLLEDAGKPDLIPAVTKVARKKCVEQVSFIKTYGLQAFAAHLELEADTIRATIESDECQRAPDALVLPEPDHGER